MTLKVYRQKRNFNKTSEPKGKVVKDRSKAKKGKGKELSFFVQKHDASRLHYDFRLEMHGVLVSWAVPKGPSLDPADKRLAVHVEDHPLSYGGFEGSIPEGEYGAGEVIVWDHGKWKPLEDISPEKGLEEGRIKFELQGKKLKGAWSLVRMKTSDSQDAWLLIKDRDDFAISSKKYDILEKMPKSVISSKVIKSRKAKS